MAKEEKIESTSSEKPAKNLSKVTKKTPLKKKQTQTSRMTEMVTSAIQSLAKSEGVTLPKIRGFIEKTFFEEMNKSNKSLIKKVIRKEFVEGRIVMTNDNSNKVDLTKRFRMADQSDMDTDTDTDTDTDEE